MPITLLGNYNSTTVTAIGLDLSSNELRFEALETAARTSSFTASRPVVLVSRSGRARGILVVAPVYSNRGMQVGGGIEGLPTNIDLAALAGEIAPGVNRITSPIEEVQQHTHNATDECGEVFRATCLPFTSPEDAMAAYNQSLMDVEAGLRDHPLEPCSSRCVNGHLMRGHVLAAFFFAAISNQADIVRDVDSPVAIYSEDVTELVNEASERLDDGQGGLTGAREQEHDEYAYLARDEGFQRLANSPLFDLFAEGTELVLRHSVPPGLGDFQYGINDVREEADPASDEAQVRVLNFVRAQASDSSRSVTRYLLPVGNRVWSIHVAATEEFYERQGTTAWVAPVLAGTLVSIIIAALVSLAFFVSRQ